MGKEVRGKSETEEEREGKFQEQNEKKYVRDLQSGDFSLISTSYPFPFFPFLQKINRERAQCQ